MSSVSRRFLAFALVLAGLCTVVTRLAAEDVPEKEIKAALVSPDSHLRHNLWKKLNPESESQYKYIVQILKALPWHDREGAILALAKAATEETLKKVTRDLKSHKDPAVRQGIAVALAKMDDEKFYPQLFESLKDKDPMVRRIVVHSLGITKKRKEKVEALILAFQNETDPVVKSYFVNALNEQTQAFQGPDPRTWFGWWQEAQSDPNYELGKTDEEALKKAEELGNKLKKRQTVSITGGVTLETEERGKGKGVPILILPEYGLAKEMMTPFLSELEKTNKLFYIDLPMINSFKGLQVQGKAQLPFYPIDQLVEAFEDLRKETKQERFALMACGLNCWIAMRYASLHPESVSHMVLICPISSDKAYGEATDRMVQQGKAKGDIELWHYGLTRRVNVDSGQSFHDQHHEKEKLPKPDGEDAALDRRSWSLFFADERDSIIASLYPKRHRWLGNVLIPQFRCFQEPKRSIPTIVIVGRHCIYSSVDDAKAIAKHYGGPCYIYENSSFMPFCEESATFNKHMAALLKEAPRKSTKKK